MKHLHSIYTFLLDQFHQSLFLEYRLLKRGYDLYRHEVIKQVKTFEAYREDYLSQVIYFKYNSQQELSDKNKIHSKIVHLYTNRPDLIKKHFEAKYFNYHDCKRLLKEYNTSSISTLETQPLLDNANLTEEEKQIRLEQIKTEIFAYYTYKKNKQLGDRIFGYLISSELIPAYTPDERREAWETFMGKDLKPSDNRLHNNPKLNRSKGNQKLIEDLEIILDLFSKTELFPAQEKVQADLKKLIDF